MRQMQIRRSDIRSVEIVEADDGSLEPGQARLTIERLAMTANTVTYAAVGETIGYWKFYPCEREGWGICPAWGYAVVSQSTGPLQEGARYYGFWPIATSVVVTPGRVHEAGFTESSPHRSSLPSVYNQYRLAPVEDTDDLRALLQPLLATSYMLDDFLSDNAFFGAEQVIIGSASSKTGLGLAMFLAARRPDGPRVVGITGSGNVAFCEGLGFYDQVIDYDRLSQEIAQRPSVYVDMSGNAEILRKVHTSLADALKHSCAVGVSHWDKFDRDSVDGLPGVRPQFFFAPSWIDKRREDWGAVQLATRLDGSWRGLADNSADWLSVVEHRGFDKIPAVWRDIANGVALPSEGHIAVLSG